MCEHLEGCSMLEKGGPRYALPLCARREDREREGTLTHKPGSVNGKCQSDRGQVIGGKLLMGQLALWGGHLGYLAVCFYNGFRASYRGGGNRQGKKATCEWLSCRCAVFLERKCRCFCCYKYHTETKTTKQRRGEITNVSR